MYVTVSYSIQRKYLSDVLVVIVVEVFQSVVFNLKSIVVLVAILFLLLYILLELFYYY